MKRPILFILIIFILLIFTVPTYVAINDVSKLNSKIKELENDKVNCNSIAEERSKQIIELQFTIDTLTFKTN